MQLRLGMRMNRRRRRAAGLPASLWGFPMPAVAPDGMDTLMTSLSIAEIESLTGWSVGAIADAAMTFSGGKAQASGAQAATRYFQLATPSVAAGKKLTGVVDVSAQSGNVSLAGNNASITKTGAITAPGRYMSNFTATAAGPVNVRQSFVAGVSGTIESVHIFDLEAMLAKPQALFGCVTQSNWVGSTRTLDRLLDLPAYGCLVWPGAGNPSRGYVLDGSGNGVPALACDPVAHTFGPNTGGGPAGAFLREVRKYIPNTYTPMYVATGYAGQGFAGNGLWSKTSPDHSAYDNFWKQMRAAWAAAPPGSFIAGIIICGFESDLGAGQQVDMMSTVDGLPSLMNEIRAEPGWGEVPFIIAEPGGSVTLPEANAQNTLDLIANLRKLRTGSGDALEYSRCKYVPRPPGYATAADFLADGLAVHFPQAADRIRGPDVARAWRDIAYQL